MSSITHFYHLAAPSYVQGPAIRHGPRSSATATTARCSGQRERSTTGNAEGIVPDADPDSQQLWDAVIISYVKALKMRRLTFEAGALFAGRMPMTSCFVAGGVSNDISVAGDQFPGGFVGRCQKFAEIIQTVGEWIAREYVPIAFTLGLLYVDFDNQYNTGVNSNDLNLVAGKNYGGGLGQFLAWGGFPDTGATGTLFSKGGIAGVNAAPSRPSPQATRRRSTRSSLTAAQTRSRTT